MDRFHDVVMRARQTDMDYSTALWTTCIRMA
jgi:hypothetical protein